MHSNLKPSNILIPSSETLYIVALIKIYQSGWLLVVGILQGSPNLSYWRLVGDILYSCISGTIAEFFFPRLTLSPLVLLVVKGEKPVN